VKTLPLIVVAFTVLLSFALNAQSEESPSSGTTLTANPVFVKACARCHGKTGEGRGIAGHFGGPPLKSDKVASASADDLRKIINNGKGHMPSYSSKLTSDEIDTLVQQVQAFNKK